jgi:hypothetical protein
MSEVRYGNLVDHSSGGDLTRWWGLGLLSLAEVAPRWHTDTPLTLASSIWNMTQVFAIRASGRAVADQGGAHDGGRHAEYREA